LYNKNSELTSRNLKISLTFTDCLSISSICLSDYPLGVAVHSELYDPWRLPVCYH